jgi:hypothetical protein
MDAGDGLMMCRVLFMGLCVSVGCIVEESGRIAGLGGPWWCIIGKACVCVM